MFTKFYYILILIQINHKFIYQLDEEDWPNPAQFHKENRLSNKECIQRIYSDCNYPTTFSAEELENVRQFLNYSFTVLSDIKPDKPLCHKIHVRQDWKCLSHKQKNRIINVWQQMYERGDVQYLTDYHVKYWPAWHKSGEFYANHRWICNEFERRMRSIDPGVTLPYWDSDTYGCQAERSNVWDILGHSGNYSDGYCVGDGIYYDWNLVPCVKRHWSPRGTIYPWYTPEVIAYILQNSDSFGDMASNMIGDHFPVHINIGGWEGQYSVPGAPYDVIFYMHHMNREENLFLRWQLQKPENLVPLSYNINNWKYNPKTGLLDKADIATDVINGVPEVTVRETFWVGFGNQCYITDQMVKPINRIWKGLTNRNPIPIAAKRLPRSIFKKHYPAFFSGNYSEFYHAFEDVGQCNTRCVPLPKYTLLSDTEAGRRQLRAHAYQFELATSLLEREEKIYQLWYDLNAAGYCSPYVTTY